MGPPLQCVQSHHAQPGLQPLRKPAATEVCVMSLVYYNSRLLLNTMVQSSILCVGVDLESGGTSTSGRGAEDVAPSTVWAAVVNFERVGKKDNTDGGDGESHRKRKEGPYIVDVLVKCSSDTIPGTGPKRSAV